jgi:hypothetical protein
MEVPRWQIRKAKVRPEMMTYESILNHQIMWHTLAAPPTSAPSIIFVGSGVVEWGLCSRVFEENRGQVGRIQTSSSKCSDRPATMLLLQTQAAWLICRLGRFSPEAVLAAKLPDALVAILRDAKDGSEDIPCLRGGSSSRALSPSHSPLNYSAGPAKVIQRQPPFPERQGSSAHSLAMSLPPLESVAAATGALLCISSLSKEGRYICVCMCVQSLREYKLWWIALPSLPAQPST